MRHDICVEGAGFRLRPVADKDAPLILALRSDPDLNRFLHVTPPSLESQLNWLSAYYDRPGDYYFVVESRSSSEAHGLISIYEIDSCGFSAVWGRWIIKKGSLAAVESVALMYFCAFETLGLNNVRSQTVVENKSVVAFHDSCGAKRLNILPGYFNIDGSSMDAIEHQVDVQLWRSTVHMYLDGLSKKIALRLNFER
ncbi:GNAT family N-acetyltransferase [Castellaniella hirudinis]|uniref:GNAT family N-acetyltransferase n=1 Tax=Castellaniella hirudinis TaxID=1144617 RepID=UPI0039C35376